MDRRHSAIIVFAALRRRMFRRQADRVRDSYAVVRSVRPFRTNGFQPRHHLTGNEEVLAVAPGAPTPADSKGQGQAIFRVNDDGTAVDFQLIASNIDNVVGAHSLWVAWRQRADPHVAVSDIGPAVWHSPARLARKTASLRQERSIPPASSARRRPLAATCRCSTRFARPHLRQRAHNDGVARPTQDRRFSRGEIRGQLDRPGPSQSVALSRSVYSILT